MQLPGGGRKDIATVEKNHALRWGFQAQHYAAKGRLAAAALSDKAKGLPPGNCQINAVNGFDRTDFPAQNPAGYGIVFLDVTDFYKVATLKQAKISLTIKIGR
jgi:hypothetical protein